MEMKYRTTTLIDVIEVEASSREEAYEKIVKIVHEEDWTGWMDSLADCFDTETGKYEIGIEKI
jgi:hypothetical protein